MIEERKAVLKKQEILLSKHRCSLCCVKVVINPTCHKDVSVFNCVFPLQVAEYLRFRGRDEGVDFPPRGTRPHKSPWLG